MDDQSRRPAASTYVIRVWREATRGAALWRGQIEHLQTGQRAAFQDLERILAFIRSSGAFADVPRGAAGGPLTEVRDET